MKTLFKLLSRLSDYRRGLTIFLLIKLDGGICEGIPRIGRNTYFKYPPHKGYKLGRACEIGPNCYLDIPEGATLKLGHRTKLTGYTVLSAAHQVEIEDDALIAEFVSIRDAEHHYASRETVSSQGLSHSAIKIGSDTWIGRGCTVLQGSVIENGCILGANSLVKKTTLTAYGVYVGSPPRMIKSRS
jgi:acetyltransferase-like isoleucine patch superfamily enzyme